MEAQLKLALGGEQAGVQEPRCIVIGTPRKPECSTAANTSPRSTVAGTPMFTPRMTSNVPPLNAPNRRRVSFVENMGFDAEVFGDEECDFFEDILRNSTTSYGCAHEVREPSLPEVPESSDEAADVSDSDSEFGDIYDEYDFDHTKIAEMVQAGADREKLTNAIEEAMTAALERKLKTKAAAPVVDVVGADNPYANGALQPGQAVHDLAGMMTPGRVTPSEEVADAPDAQLVAARVHEALNVPTQRRRKSSIAGKGVIAEATHMATVRRRESLTACMDQPSGYGDVQAKITAARQNANRRHRQSILKAAEVLEDTGCEETMQVSEVTEKMAMIEVAMVEARRRHRRSIASAIQHLQEPDGQSQAGHPEVFVAPAAQPRLNAAATTFVPASQTSFPGAPETNLGTPSQWAQQESWHSWNDSNQYWEQPSCPFQARINQAMSSAYHSYCATEQYPEGVYDEYGCWQQAQSYTATNSNCYQPLHGGVQAEHFGVNNAGFHNGWNASGSVMGNGLCQERWTAPQDGNYYGQSNGAQMGLPAPSLHYNALAHSWA